MAPPPSLAAIVSRCRSNMRRSGPNTANPNARTSAVMKIDWMALVDSLKT